ncbi:MAG: alcohol dehydrogenase catalytic domain-containing protein [Microbacterium sp.]|uniref:alcohol dehydrogenase catalytic domain-containing protein n=1 Tax=Microbacterium sp. TaxID=51671 RepID=UPI0032423DB8
MLTARTVSRATLSYDEMPLPVLQPNHVLVRIHAVSLCGTDLHIYEDDFPTDLPIVQGHEMAGVVIAADPAAAVRPGDRVAVDPLVACGRCRACRRGRSNVCQHLSVLGCYEDGGFAEVLSVPAERVHAVPDGLSLEMAALGEPASISLQAVERSEARAGDVAVVLGCGPIGLLAILGLAERGATVIAADTDPARAALAEVFGAAAAFVVGEGFPDAAQRRLIDDATEAAGPDAIIEATGVPASLQNAIRMIGAGGRIIQVGISTQPAAIRIKDITDKEIDLRGSRNSRGMIPAGLAMLARHPEAASALLTHRFAFARLDEAFRTMADRAIPTGKIVILMPAAEEVPA